MKKSIIVMMAAVLIFSLCGCAKQEPVEDTEVSIVETETPETKEIKTATEETAEVPKESNVGMANPWIDTDEKGVMEKTGLKFGTPDNIKNITYRVFESEGLAEMNFTMLEGEAFTARAKATGQAEDISGMYYTWDKTEEREMNGRKFKVMTAEGGKVQLCTYFDAVPGISYSLSLVSDHDMSGFDIVVLADGIFVPMQGEAAGDEKTQEGDLVSKNFDEVAGTYVRSDDGSTLEIKKDGTVTIGITRLTEMEGKAEGIYKGIVPISVKDANDNPMGLEFYPETGELMVTDSTWTYLPNGETIKFDKKK